MTTTTVKIHGVDTSKINPTENITSFGVSNGQAETRANVTLIKSDDWDGLFINGKLVMEGHSFTAFDLLELLSEVGKFTYERYYAHQETLETYGSFPITLEETRLKGIL